VKVLYAGDQKQWGRYEPALTQALAEAGISAEIGIDWPPDEVDYIVFAPSGPVSNFTPFVKAKAVLSLWAGVEKIVGNQTLTQPLTRMVDQGLREGMVEWVVGQVLRHHLGLDPLIWKERLWEQIVPPLARDRVVGVLGLGELGGACARALAALNFDVRGWSRRPHDEPGVTCLYGCDGLTNLLQTAEILVLLLPKTPDTENVMNAETLAMLPKGAVVINPGRGALIDDDALLAALDNGHLAHATLDVFRTEPLPLDHAFWHHPR
jgi:glyoxylate/hydroxypyruvate reductase